MWKAVVTRLKANSVSEIPSLHCTQCQLTGISQCFELDVSVGQEEFNACWHAEHYLTADQLWSHALANGGLTEAQGGHSVKTGACALTLSSAFIDLMMFAP